jgi:hypothetical protein
MGLSDLRISVHLHWRMAAGCRLLCLLSAGCCLLRSAVSSLRKLRKKRKETGNAIRNHSLGENDIKWRERGQPATRQRRQQAAMQHAAGKGS